MGKVSEERVWVPDGSEAEVSGRICEEPGSLAPFHCLMRIFWACWKADKCLFQDTPTGMLLAFY